MIWVWLNRWLVRPDGPLADLNVQLDRLRVMQVSQQAGLRSLEDVVLRLRSQIQALENSCGACRSRCERLETRLNAVEHRPMAPRDEDHA